MADLRVRIRDLELSNPIIISSGHVSRRPESIEKADSFEAGAIVIKTSFLEKEYEEVVNPYKPGLFPDVRIKFRTPEGGDGLLGLSGLSSLPLEAWAKWFRERKKILKTPVIASMAAISIEGYIQGAKIFQESGADALELLLGCPLPYLMPHKYVGGASFNRELVEEICKAVRKAVDIPLGVKMMFNPMDPSPLNVPLEAGCDFITLVAIVPAAPGVNLNTLEPQMPTMVWMAGSRSANKHQNFFGMTFLADQIKDIHISATGGCQSWEDVAEYIMYGASSVQIQVLFIKEGFGVLTELKEGLSRFMDEKGFENIEQMKGLIPPKLISYDEAIAAYGPTKGKIYATVDQNKCTLCGICVNICIYEAISILGNELKIRKELCEACNICVDRCPESALKLENVNSIKEAAQSFRVTVHQ